MTSLTKEKLLFLQNKALNIRIDSIRSTTASKSGHPTSCLSAADIIATLFFHTMKYDKSNPKASNNDRFILSKGHAIPVVYAAWKQADVIDDEMLMSLRNFDSVLEGHPTPRFEYNEAATGSLGQGLAIGVGVAMAARLDNHSYKTYVMVGDGEAAEGSIWEAAELAAYYKLNNLVGILDCNRLGQSEESIHEHNVDVYKKKFDAFGWRSIIVDGHNIEEIASSLESLDDDKPTMIIAKTFKGHGLQEIENENGFHGKPFKDNDAINAIEKLKETYKDHLSSDLNFEVEVPKSVPINKRHAALNFSSEPKSGLFKKGEKLATRKAYGYALAALGRNLDDIIVLDADVKNSTFTQTFGDEFPDRFIQCFIAEQCMVSVATGLELRGKNAFCATFGAFFARAFDQIRMAGIGRNAIKLCGSHCGVSIGEDGPSQMGLEDIAMMRTIPNSIVIYPSDGVSTYKLLEKIANYDDGISYMRTTRMDTENLYDLDEEFEIGGSKVLRQGDQACIIAAGVTLHEALKAHQELMSEGIEVSVIDLYSIKPLDVETILKEAKKSKFVLTVEDHYQAGGIGEAVKSALVNHNITIKSLAVEEVSRSGKPEELLAFAKIDSNNIVKIIKESI